VTFVFCITGGQIPGFPPGMDPLFHSAAAGAYQRNPGLIPPRDAVLSLHPEMRGIYPPELAHHVNTILNLSS